MVGASIEGWAQSAFDLRDNAFAVRPLSVVRRLKVVVHFFAVGCLWSDVWISASEIERDHGFWDSQFLSAKSMKRFRVISSVSEEADGLDSLCGLANGLREVGRIVTWPTSEFHSGNEMRMVITDESGFDPRPMFFAAALGPLEKVPANVVRVPSGAIERHDRLGRQSAVRSRDLAI